MAKAATILTGLIFVALAMSGCASVKASESAVERFRQQYNEKKFSEIYAEAGEALKKEYSEREMIDKLERTYAELGAEKSSKETAWKMANGWTFLDYETEFERGRRTERFIYSMDGERALLATYKIN